MDNHTSHDSSSSRAGPWPTLACFRYGRGASTAALPVRWMRGRTAESTYSCWRPSSPPAGRRTPSAAWHTRARPSLPHGQRTRRIALLALRFVTNIGVGFAVVVAPVYVAEVAPASSWGALLVPRRRLHHGRDPPRLHLQLLRPRAACCCAEAGASCSPSMSRRRCSSGAGCSVNKMV
jgi:hypothetical protein